MQYTYKYITLSFQGYRVFRQKELENYINNRKLSCDFVDTHREDIISTTEMEICRRGVIFLRYIGYILHQIYQVQLYMALY